MAEFVPLRKKLKRAGTGEEDNFVPSYLPELLRGASESSTAGGSAEKVAEFRWRHGIEVSGGDGCPPPIQDFSQLQLGPGLSSRLAEKGYRTPTPVQMQTVPIILQGRDAIVLAETGSGKTLAYVLPLCALLSLFPPVKPGEGPRSLILAPTRELAQQIQKYAQQFIGQIVPKNHHHGNSPGCYSSVLVCGGLPLQKLITAIKHGVDVVVATPGKLLMLLDQEALSLATVSYLVIDEADRFMRGGMEEDLRRIVMKATDSLRPRQTLLFSATLPENLDRLARSAVLNPVTIEVGAIGLTAANLEQNVVFMHSYRKPKQLLDVLRRTESPPVLVFCNSVQGVEEVVDLLSREQFHVAGLHSEKPQAVRFEIIDLMRKGGVDVLVATDVASRGIDVPGITHVINYDIPDSIETYIHRCGRTARLQSKGLATSFLTLDCRIAGELRDLLASLDQPVPLELQDLRQFGHRVLQTELGDRVVP